MNASWRRQSQRLAVAVAVAIALSRCPVLRGGGPAVAPVAFEKRTLETRYYCDGLNVGDFDRDGHPDIVAGPYWYEGPAFTRRHAIFEPTPFAPDKEQSNSMFSFVHDFDRDGWPDVLVLGRVHLHPARWYENPRGRDGHWKEHFVFERVRGESPPFVDIDRDGHPELVCHWEGRWGWVTPVPGRPTEPWTFHAVTEPGNYNQFYHGTGVGDIDGDGRPDLITNEGWWSQPPGSVRATWARHPFRFSEQGGAQMFAYDVDGDGDQDVITSLDAHGWGLAWFEHVREGDRITFRRHAVMGDRSEEEHYGVAFSQPHALALADIDGDGLADIVTGKRRWAHGPTGDLEPDGEPVIYWFRLARGPGGAVQYEPYRIDANSGVGVQIVAADVNGDGRPDVLTASKLGTFLFLNRPGGR